MDAKPFIISLLETLRKQLNSSDIQGAQHTLDLLYAELDTCTVTKKKQGKPIHCN